MIRRNIIRFPGGVRGRGEIEIAPAVIVLNDVVAAVTDIYIYFSTANASAVPFCTKNGAYTVVPPPRLTNRYLQIRVVVTPDAVFRTDFGTPSSGERFGNSGAGGTTFAFGETTGDTYVTNNGRGATESFARCPDRPSNLLPRNQPNDG